MLVPYFFFSCIKSASGGWGGMTGRESYYSSNSNCLGIIQYMRTARWLIAKGATCCDPHLTERTCIQFNFPIRPEDKVQCMKH